MIKVSELLKQMRDTEMNLLFAANVPVEFVFDVD